MLKTAVLLADLRSFRRVAETLNITQAAVSSRISAIEQDLGVRIFDRDSKSVETTERGREFVTGAKEVLLAFDRLAQKFVDDSKFEGEIRLGFVSSMSSTLMPLVVNEMRRKFEHVRFTIHSDIGSNLEALLKRGELDIALVAADKLFSDYHKVPLCSFGARWMASPALMDEYDLQDDAIDDETFFSLPIIAYDAGTTGYESLLSVVTKDEIDGVEVHSSNSLPTSISMACAGLGIASIPPVVIQRELKEGALRVMNTKRHLPDIEFWAVSRAGASDALSAATITLLTDAAARFCANFEDPIAIVRPFNSSINSV